jgi:hypothetical protein
MSGLNEPGWNDAVMGGDNPAPNQAAVLGGLWQVQQRLGSEDLRVKFAAMRDCLKYGEAGVAEVIPFLEDALPRSQFEAYQLLRSRSEESVKQALKQYKFWRHFERLDGHPSQHAHMFANRQVIDPAFRTMENLQAIALGFRENKWAAWDQRDDEDPERKLLDFLMTDNISSIEAIVFGYGISGPDTNALLIRECNSLSHLKAIFIGDIEDREQMISMIDQSDLGPVLNAYPNLEMLHIRGDSKYRKICTGKDGLRFSQVAHSKLTTLRIETGGLNRQAIRDLCKLSLPSLEYLELWMGREEYGGDSNVEDLMPIISGESFPNLKYLGLRNCEYTDDIAIALAQFPPRPKLIELDLSIGTLSSLGANALLNSEILNSLTTLNISQSGSTRNLPSPFAKLNCSVICDRPNLLETLPNEYLRYCVVGE